MIRGGTKVSAPAITSPPRKIPCIDLRCPEIRPVRACHTATGSITSTNTEIRWMNENRPGPATSLIQKLDSATINPTNTQPNSRCGGVPLAAANCNSPSIKAATAAAAWICTATGATNIGCHVIPGESLECLTLCVG